ncbi:MAG: AMP-binding protein [Alphaproteobacteria bacterium]|nr:AMP-binding protein [Alphaproteobacteria bacterium]
MATFADVADETRRLVSGLIDLGIGPGVRVAMIGPNSLDWVIVRLALGAGGAVLVAIDDLATDQEIGAILQRSHCRFVFCSGAHAASLRERYADSDLEIWRLDAATEASQPARSWRTLLAREAEPLPRFDADAPMMLVYTSGTTGKPKGFTLSSNNVWANVGALVVEQLIEPGDRVLLPLPLHHAYPQVIGLFTTLACGAAVVFPESPTGPHIVNALKTAGVSGIIGVPRLYTALVTAVAARISAKGAVVASVFRVLLSGSILAYRRLGLRIGKWLFQPIRKGIGPRLRLLVSGGAHLEPAVLWQLIALGFDVRSGYGLAETASIFTGNLPGRERMESEGRALGQGRIRIAESNDLGIGEIQLKGPSVFDGYADAAEANSAVFTEDGWFRSGDLGYLDEDSYLYVTGRAKEVIVLGGGKNVYPEELEKAYSDSPYIEAIALLERNGALAALVEANVATIRADGFSRVEDVLRVTLKDIGQRLPSYQRLSGFAIADSPLPRTRLGKFRRHLLPELYEQALAEVRASVRSEPSQADEALLKVPAARAVWGLLARRYPADRLTPDADLELDLGIDSLEWMALALDAESRLGLRLDEAVRSEVSTVRDLLHLASRRRAEGERPTEGAPSPVEADAATRWLQPTGTVTRVVTRLLHGLNRILVRVLFRLETSGLEHLPDDGPLVIAPNHASDLDPSVLAAALPWRITRRLYWSGDAGRLFGVRWLRPFLRAAHVFPVDGRLPAASLSLAAEVLKRGKILAWFPEEWRSPTGELQTFQPGVGWLLRETRAPVVPVLIEGSFEALPRQRRLPRLTRIRIRFGAPLGIAELSKSAGEAAEPIDLAAALRNSVAALYRRKTDQGA